MLYLKKYVKYRKETDYVLICDCSTIQNFELPLETFEVLEALKSGYDKNKPIGIDIEEDLILDFEELGLVDNIPNSSNGFHNNNWVNLSYDESEFFV